MFDDKKKRIFMIVWYGHGCSMILLMEMAAIWQDFGGGGCWQKGKI